LGLLKISFMTDYAAVDAVLFPWAEARGLHVYTGHCQNVVRSVTIYVWIGARHESTGHIWLDSPNELGLIGLHAAHRDFRIDEAVALSSLAGALDSVSDRLAAHKRLAEAG
jgi:hypothetical protein